MTTQQKRARRDAWTPEEDAALLRLYPIGGWYAVHEATGRPKTGIRSRAHAIGAKDPSPEALREIIRAAALRRYGPPSTRQPAHKLQPAPAITATDRQSMPETPAPVMPGPRHARYMKADGRTAADVRTLPRVASVFELGEALHA